MNALYYLPLGGAAEIGMNMYLYGYGPKDDIRWIMVDCGIGFPDTGYAPGIETMTADPAFIAEQSERLDAIFITHAHEDHIGAIGWHWANLDAPVYCTAFPAEIARRKLEEAGVDPKVVNECEPDVPVRVGDFEVSFFPMTHSIPEASALVIRTPEGIVFHSADFKIDPDPIYGKPIDFEALRALGDEGVLALVCDSTNVFEPGRSGSEISLRDPLRGLIQSRKGRIAATTFASNVARLKTLADAARDSGRGIVVAGRAMRRMIEVGVRTGAVPDFPATLSESEARDMPDEHLFYLVTGSQGEGRAAMARIASRSHPSVKLSEGDTVIFSSKTIPGNEVEVSNIYNKLAEQGVEVLDSDMETVHVSGHACRDELRDVYLALRPRIAVPMHGELRHLREHARMAKTWGAGEAHVVSNGEILRIAPHEATVIDEVPCGRRYRDGDIIIGAMDGVVRQRKKMAMNGHLAVSIIVDEDGDLIVETDVRTSGLPEAAQDADTSFEDRIASSVDDTIESLPRKARRDDDVLEDKAYQAARRIAQRIWGKKPETVVMITRLDGD